MPSDGGVPTGGHTQCPRAGSIPTTPLPDNGSSENPICTMTTSANRSRFAAAIMHQPGLERQRHAPRDDARTGDGTAHPVMSPLEFIQRPPALAPGRTAPGRARGAKIEGEVAPRGGQARVARVGGRDSARVIAGEFDFRNAS
jgi:hypothetical protein